QEDDTQIAEQTNQTAGATVMVVDEQQQAVSDNDDSDRDTVGDEHCCSDFGNDADDDVSERLPQADDNIAPALYTASSIDSLDLLAAVNRPQLRQQEDPSSLSSTVDHYLAARLAGDESSEDFSDLVPNSSDKFGFSDSESLSSSLLDSAVGGASGERRPSIRWINLLGDNAPAVFGSSTSICGVCSKKVYPMEMVTTNGVAYHKFCCKCSKCNRVLSVGNFGVLSGALYCQVHYTDAVRLQDAPLDKKSANLDNSEPTETADPIRGRLKRRTSQADELPPPGISKNILNFFHGLEQQSSVQKQQKLPPVPQQQQQQSAVGNNRLSVCTDESTTPKLVSPTSPAPPVAVTAVVSEPLEALKNDQPTADDPSNKDCLPEQGTAKALLNLWRQKEAAGTLGGLASNYPAADLRGGGRRGSLVKSLGSAATTDVVKVS
uniref:LIM zinc-binding domain-containing protein n=1 Tax=Macrostomum lignano TaxID=282301 RepID=A0A1I8I137_9PLAT